MSGTTPPPFSSAVGEFDVEHSPIERTIGVILMPSVPDVERLYDNIQMLLPAITTPVIDIELWNAVSEFCIRSTYLRARVYWTMAPGIPTVDFNPFSADMVVVWVLYAHGLTQWEIIPPAQLVDLQPPTAARNGWAMLALRPSRFDVLRLNYIPELFTTWFETMLDGTLFRLYGMPAKPWSSTQLAAYHGGRFRQGMMRARDIAERRHSHQQSPRNVFPYFAAGRRKQ